MKTFGCRMGLLFCPAVIGLAANFTAVKAAETAGRAPGATTCPDGNSRGFAEDPEVLWWGFSASAIPSTATGPYEYRVGFAPAPDSARLDLSSGGRVGLAPVGGGVWSCTVTGSQLLSGYTSAEVNHNFVGFLRTFKGAKDPLQYNVFVNVIDDSVPAVTPETIDGGWQYSCRVANYWYPGVTLPADEPTLRHVTQQFYARFGDDYDFLNVVFALPGYFDNRAQYVVRNDVSGIGQSLFDDAAAWGSGGRLRGVTRYPIPTLFDLANHAAIHELGHTWINYCTFPPLSTAPYAHWPPGTQARGPMGVNLPGGAGGDFPYDLEPQPNGDYRMVFTGITLPDFTDLDLYLMGFLPSDSVGSNFVFSDPEQAVCHGCEGPVMHFTVADVIAAQGPRVPDAVAAPRRFRIGTVVVSRDRLLDAGEMAMYEYFAQRGERTVPTPTTSGFASSIAHPFRLATRGLGTLETWLLDACSPLLAVLLPPASPALRLAGQHPVLETAMLEWSQPARAPVRLEVFSVSGQCVTRLVDGEREAGVHRVAWPVGRSTGLDSGVYFARLRVEGMAASTRRIVVTR